MIFAGPCGIENETVPMTVAEKLTRALEKYPEVKYVFKSSWKKANRTRADSFKGIDFDEAMRILTKVRTTFNVPVITDVHETEQVTWLEPFVDYLQIPAFLCRQQDLVYAAAASKPVMIKKGQFLSPHNMKYVLEVARSAGQQEVYSCERGSSFGHDSLVVDYSGLPVMRSFGPVIFDGTHCLQKQSSVGVTGGQREMIGLMSQAAVAIGIDGLFLEVHSDIPNAKSDQASQLEVDKFEELIEKCMQIRSVVN